MNTSKANSNTQSLLSQNGTFEPTSVESVRKTKHELLAGAAAGAASVFVGYPFDTIKVQMQARPGTFKDSIECTRSLIRQEGFGGLFRGMSSPLWGGMVESAINYAVYSKVLNHLSIKHGTTMDDASMSDVVVAAASAGVALSFALGPTELIKCRMQATTAAAYRSTGDCIRHLIRTEGYQGLYRGLGATMLREAPGNAIFFAVYEGLRRWLPGKDTSSRTTTSTAATAASTTSNWIRIISDAGSSIVCGGIAGSVMWACVLPVDAAKTRLQTASPGSPWDVSMGRHLKLMWREGGTRALFAGIGPTLIRAFPTNAMQWLAWEVSLKALA